ncbi:MAG: hypothetical protein RR140_02320 [Clostridia bacterium]
MNKGKTILDTMVVIFSLLTLTAMAFCFIGVVGEGSAIFQGQGITIEYGYSIFNLAKAEQTLAIFTMICGFATMGLGVTLVILKSLKLKKACFIISILMVVFAVATLIFSFVTCNAINIANKSDNFTLLSGSIILVLTAVFAGVTELASNLLKIKHKK